MKVSELEGAELDYWVAVAEGKNATLKELLFNNFDCSECGAGLGFTPSTDWLNGGPIIERERIWLSDDNQEWIASCRPHIDDAIHSGPTPLIAAMRAYVASKFGDTVEDK